MAGRTIRDSDCRRTATSSARAQGSVDRVASIRPLGSWLETETIIGNACETRAIWNNHDPRYWIIHFISTSTFSTGQAGGLSEAVFCRLGTAPVVAISLIEMSTVEHPLSRQIRRGILEQSKRANVGHIGSALSVADLLAAIFSGVLKTRSPSDPERDRFILSKGHAALALYVALHATGRLTDTALQRFCTEGSPLATHPEHVVRGVDFSTGSLGQGLSYTAGAALAARMQRSPRRAFVLMSDAECNEGAVWETVMFAAHHRLGNLTAVVDVNGQQALGYTREILDLAPLSARWRAFGWDVHEVDGHDVDLLIRTLQELPADDSAPHVLLARTTFGKGVSYMESKIAWHYLPMSDVQYATALAELGGQL